MSGVTTEIVDQVTGKPAANIKVSFCFGDGSVLGTQVTNQDGQLDRIFQLDPDYERAFYELRFDVRNYLRVMHNSEFFDTIRVRIRTTPEAGVYHMPLLLSPDAYSTRREGLRGAKCSSNTGARCD